MYVELDNDMIILNVFKCMEKFQPCSARFS